MSLLHTLRCNAVNKDIIDIDWLLFYQATNVNFALECFNALAENIFDEHPPIKEKKRVTGKGWQWLIFDLKK